MITFETKVINIIDQTPGVKSFRFETKKDLDFKAGQFFFVTIRVGDGEGTKHFSFSNSPSEKGYIEFTKRITGSPFSKALNRLNIGDWARLKMPLGSFTFEGEYAKIALLSGGIGITPIRSICKYATDIKLPTDIALFYGNSKEKDVIFKRDFDDMQKLNKNFHIVYTLTSQDIDKKEWKGRTGYIDDKMIQEEMSDYKDRIFYICGPPKMVDTLVNVLKDKLGIQDDKIKLENFTGY